MSWQYTDIASKVRLITGRLKSEDMSDSDISDYINNFYIFEMPAHLKTKSMLEDYTFYTQDGVAEYDFPTSTFINVEPRALADGNELVWYESKDAFRLDYPIQYSDEDIGSGDGVTVNFTGTLDTNPIIKGSAYFYDPVERLIDNGDGTLTGSAGGSGTITYSSGAYNITFNTAPTSSATISAKVEGYLGNRPEAILFYNNKFILRAVPDDTYKIEMQGYLKPSAMSGTSTALEEELGPYIAYGAALNIFSEYGQLEQYGQYQPIFNKFEAVAITKTLQQTQNQRIFPRW